MNVYGSKVIDCRVHSAHFDFLEVGRRHHLYTSTFIHLKRLMNWFFLLRSKLMLLGNHQLTPSGNMVRTSRAYLISISLSRCRQPLICSSVFTFFFSGNWFNCNYTICKFCTWNFFIMPFSFTHVLACRQNSTFSLHNSILLHRCNIFNINLIVDRYTDSFQIWAIRICSLWYFYYDMLCCKHICIKTPIFISFVNRPRSRLPGSHVNLFITLIKPANCFPQMTATVPISSCSWQVVCFLRVVANTC